MSCKLIAVYNACVVVTIYILKNVLGLAHVHSLFHVPCPVCELCVALRVRDDEQLFQLFAWGYKLVSYSLLVSARKRL